MKTGKICVTTLFLVFSLSNQAQNQPAPNTRYNVNRVYDENGNLIKYDSSSVSTWTYNDSLMGTWTHKPIQDDSVFIGEQLPGNEFYFNPRVEPDFGYLDSLMNSLGFGFNPIGPIDTTGMQHGPFHNFGENMPPMTFDFESYFNEMQHMMEEIFNFSDDFHHGFPEPSLSPVEPYVPAPDSIEHIPPPEKNYGPKQEI
jgi:hypothetical protein